MKIDSSSWLVTCYLAATYAYLWCLDNIDYYHAMLIFYLPSYMFGAPIITIDQPIDSESDSDNESETTKVQVFIKRLLVVFKDSEGRMSCRKLHGAQLAPIIVGDRFYIGRLQSFFPTLDTLLITYVKMPADESEPSPMITKIIDVERRYDMSNHRSCRFGVAF